MAPLLKNRVCAGFPSPAEDLGAQRIDLTQMLVVHAQATYFLRASGHSMVEAGIFDNDILVVDRAIKPRHNHIVVAVVGNSPANTVLAGIWTGAQDRGRCTPLVVCTQPG